MRHDTWDTTLAWLSPGVIARSTACCNRNSCRAQGPIDKMPSETASVLQTPSSCVYVYTSSLESLNLKVKHFPGLHMSPVCVVSRAHTLDLHLRSMMMPVDRSPQPPCTAVTQRRRRRPSFESRCEISPIQPAHQRSPLSTQYYQDTALPAMKVRARSCKATGTRNSFAEKSTVTCDSRCKHNSAFMAAK